MLVAKGTVVGSKISVDTFHHENKETKNDILRMEVFLKLQKGTMFCGNTASHFSGVRFPDGTQF